MIFWLKKNKTVIIFIATAILLGFSYFLSFNPPVRKSPTVKLREFK